MVVVNVIASYTFTSNQLTDTHIHHTRCESRFYLQAHQRYVHLHRTTFAHTHTHTKKWGHDHSSGYSALSPSPPPSRAHIFLLSTFSLRIFPRSVALTPNIYTIQPAIPHTKWKSERKKEEEEEKEEDEEEKKRRGYIHVIP